MEVAKKTRRLSVARLILLFIVITSGLLIICQNINIYKFAFVGAVFEMLWLPILLLTFMMPLVAVYFWYMEKWRVKSPFLYLIIASSIPVILLFMKPIN